MGVLRSLLGLVVIAGLVAITDLAAFAGRANTLSPPPATVSADGVAALTGGSQARLTEAMAILEAGRAGRLLVSGVHPSVTVQELTELMEAEPAVTACCVDIDRQARSTFENGQQVAAWMNAHSYSSVFIVTDDYHMARSLLEVRTALQDKRVIAYPVTDPAQSASGWLSEVRRFRRLATEWVKWRIVWTQRTIRARPAQTHSAAEPPPSA